MPEAQSQLPSAICNKFYFTPLASIIHASAICIDGRGMVDLGGSGLVEDVRWTTLSQAAGCCLLKLFLNFVFCSAG